MFVFMVGFILCPRGILVLEVRKMKAIRCHFYARTAGFRPDGLRGLSYLRAKMGFDDKQTNCEGCGGCIRMRADCVERYGNGNIISYENKMSRSAQYSRTVASLS